MDDDTWALIIALCTMVVILALGLGTLLLLAMAGLVAVVGALIP